VYMSSPFQFLIEDSRQQNFYRTRLSTLRPTPNLEDQDFLLGLSPLAGMSQF
jgi:hypothetical protein